MRATQCFRTWQNNIFCTLHLYSDLDTLRHTRCRNVTRSVKATIALRDEACISVSPNYPHLLSDLGESRYKSANNSMQRVPYVVQGRSPPSSYDSTLNYCTQCRGCRSDAIFGWVSLRALATPTRGQSVFCTHCKISQCDVLCHHKATKEQTVMIGNRIRGQTVRTF